MYSVFINTYRKVGEDRVKNKEVIQGIYSVDEHILYPESMQQKINTLNLILHCILIEFSMSLLFS